MFSHSDHAPLGVDTKSGHRSLSLDHVSADSELVLRVREPSSSHDWPIRELTAFLEAVDFFYLLLTETALHQPFLTLQSDDPKRRPGTYRFGKVDQVYCPYLAVLSIRRGSIIFEFGQDAPRGVSIGAGVLLALYLILKHPDNLMKLMDIRNAYENHKLRAHRERLEDKVLLLEAMDKLHELREEQYPDLEVDLIDRHGAEIPEPTDEDVDWFFQKFGHF